MNLFKMKTIKQCECEFCDLKFRADVTALQIEPKCPKCGSRKDVIILG